MWEIYGGMDKYLRVEINMSVDLLNKLKLQKNDKKAVLNKNTTRLIWNCHGFFVK